MNREGMGTASVLVASAKAAAVRVSVTWSKLGRNLAARRLSQSEERAGRSDRVHGSSWRIPAEKVQPSLVRL